MYAIELLLQSRIEIAISRVNYEHVDVMAPSNLENSAYTLNVDDPSQGMKICFNWKKNCHWVMVDIKGIPQDWVLSVFDKML